MTVTQEAREQRSREEPIVGGLPDVPGIVAAMSLSPGLAAHLRGLADELLVKEYPGSTLTRIERELIATAVSAGNECFYCMDSHGAFALALMGREVSSPGRALVERVKAGDLSGLSPKVRVLVELALVVQRRARDLGRDDVARAREAGATDADTQLAVLIASAFCMYNRMVDGLRARTPDRPEAYEARAAEIAEYGYSDRRVAAVPR
jgi:uncharacterized peroxidase-related enzyme